MVAIASQLSSIYSYILICWNNNVIILTKEVIKEEKLIVPNVKEKRITVLLEDIVCIVCTGM